MFGYRGWVRGFNPGESGASAVWTGKDFPTVEAAADALNKRYALNEDAALLKWEIYEEKVVLSG